MSLLISNIQRFSLHDGPGIRTTIFFMGCLLRCPWCCNPENLTKEIKKYFDINDEEKQYGREITIEELKEEILKDYDYYSNDGGVTYSGGEALLQLKEALPLLAYLKEKGISQCVETSLNAPIANLKAIMPYIDIFYVDLKIMNPSIYLEKLNGNYELFMNNLNYLKKHKKKISFRVPLVHEHTVNEENIKSIKNIVDKYSFEKATVFSVHNMGESKYKNLGMKFEYFKTIEQEVVDEVSNFINSKYLYKNSLSS